MVAGIIGIISSIWFPICGTIDLIKLFKRLETKESNDLDDGRVEGNVSLADAAELAAKENKKADS